MIKKTILLSVLAGVMSLAAMAQDDDMYFVQKREPVVTPQNKSPEGKDYYSGISRGTDDYNRRSRYWSHYQNIGSDSTGNDIVQFVKGMGASPDTVYVDSTFAGKCMTARPQTKTSGIQEECNAGTASGIHGITATHGDSDLIGAMAGMIRGITEDGTHHGMIRGTTDGMALYMQDGTIHGIMDGIHTIIITVRSMSSTTVLTEVDLTATAITLMTTAG